MMTVLICRFFIDLDAAVNLGTAFVKYIGCGNSTLLTLACIRALPTQTVLNRLLLYPGQLGIAAGTPIPLLCPIFCWGPVIDGSVVGVTDRPLNLMQRGVFNVVPIVMGKAVDELGRCACCHDVSYHRDKPERGVFVCACC